MTLKVLHFSSHFENCGIAKFQQYYLDAIDTTSKDISNKFFEYSPYQTRAMNREKYAEVMDVLVNELSHFDILHIQHEFGFFRDNQLQELVDNARKTGKKILITYHTSPDLIIIKKSLGGLGPRSIVAYLRSKRHEKRLVESHVTPLHNVDRVLVNNAYTKNKLIDFGIDEAKISAIALPVYETTTPQESDKIARALHKQKGDIIFGCVGYLHRFKGVDKAIKALTFLPKNYKLAVLGGVKSDSDDKKLYDKLTDLVVKLNLQERVYITGVVIDDDELNSYIRETDLCVYPYDSTYYKGVSSGALSLAISNERPVIAYPVPTFIEINQEFSQLVLTQSDSYYELAKEIGSIDIAAQTKRLKLYAHAESIKNASIKLASIYRSL